MSGALATSWSAIVGRLSPEDRDKVFDEVCKSGETSWRYALMAVLSAAIATLGLLLSSPAVVIGAMLLSPLMGPIILLGFAFRTVDWSGTRRAVLSLAVGLGLSLAVAVLLTWASPLKEPTAEILARTRPNLFDLLVAVFSGIAGAHAVIRQRGETVIGVAIATALAPPLATVGFGLGTRDWQISLGALLLFATNLVAIAMSAAVVAALYGFRPHYDLARRRWIGHAAVIAVLALLCVPLTVSLETIALESRATVSARRDIAKLFGPKARITSLVVRSGAGGLKVDGLVATPRFIDGASKTLAARLSSAIGAPAQVTLDQIVLADPAQLSQAPSPPSPAPPDPATERTRQLREAVPFAVQTLAYDAAGGRGVVLLQPGQLDLEGTRRLELGLRARDGLERTVVIPASQPLAPVAVNLEDKAPPAFGPELRVDLWALQRWRARGVAASVCGLSARDRRMKALATALSDQLKPLPLTLSPAPAGRCAGRSGARILLAPD